MMKLVWIGIGGGLGSVLRYLMSSATQRWLNNAWFPWGTLAVNVLGCFLLGLLGGLADQRQLFRESTRLFLTVGLLGGFTTFSTFGHETMGLLREGQAWGALANVAASVILGLLAAGLGYGLSYRL